MTDALKKMGLLADAPPFMTPWLDRFYEPDEIKIGLALGREYRPVSFFEDRLSMGLETIERSYKRGVLEKKRDDQDNAHYKIADFHTRFDIWAVFEGFKDIPSEICDQLNQWEIKHYFHAHAAAVRKIRQTGNPDAVDGTPRYLLLAESLQMLEQVDHIYLWPCNCRSMIRACSKPLYTCLRFENNRGIGFEISREKAAAIIRDANKKGLMQSGELGRTPNGNLTGAICNCCADCCFPHLLSRENNAEKIWPFSRYVACFNADECTLCGLCSKRCPFGAFVFQKKSTNNPAHLSLETDLCRGCGLCATGCPAGAITMEHLASLLEVSTARESVDVDKK